MHRGHLSRSTFRLLSSISVPVQLVFSLKTRFKIQDMNTFVVTLDVPPGVPEQSIKGIPLFPLSLKYKCHSGSFNQTLLRVCAYM